MEYVQVTEDNQYEMLGNFSIDVLVSRHVMTMSQDVYQVRKSIGGVSLWSFAGMVMLVVLNFVVGIFGCLVS